MNRLIDAILFAAQSHSGQYRKDGKTPYINHPVEVMHLLAHTGNVSDPELLVAAVLHDVVEDTQVTAHEISRRFGERVSKVVLELTDDKMLTKEDRKRLQLHLANHLSADARLIRICDKICNVHDILYAPPDDWDLRRRRDYLEWAKAVVDKIRGTNEELEKQFDELFEEGMKFLE
jgi:GTP diphosphokinase / guanosine-3',5'-bis(diphosphate) 3'-diphosphatase